MSNQPEVDSWKPPFSYDIGGDGKAYDVAVLANPDHSQGEWVKLADYRELERQRDALQKKLDEKEKAHRVTRDTARRLSAEKHQAASQRDAYAETLRQIGTSTVCGNIVRKRHPELASGSGEGSNQ